MKKLIIFDFDGVLIDSLLTVEEFDQWLYPTLSDREWRDTAMGNYFESMKRHEGKRRTATEEEFEQRRLEFYQEKALCRPFSGIPQIVHTLASTYTLAINTNSKYAGVMPWLKANGMDTAITFIASKEVSTSKREKFSIIFEKCHADNNSSYFVTDTIGDLKEAQEAKVDTACVTWGIHSRTDFEPFKPYKIIDDPKELLLL